MFVNFLYFYIWCKITVWCHDISVFNICLDQMWSDKLLHFYSALICPSFVKDSLTQYNIVVFISSGTLHFSSYHLLDFMIFDKKSSAVNLIDSPMPLKKFYYSFQDYLFSLRFECLIIMSFCEDTLQLSCLEIHLKFKSVKQSFAWFKKWLASLHMLYVLFSLLLISKVLHNMYVICSMLFHLFLSDFVCYPHCLLHSMISTDFPKFKFSSSVCSKLVFKHVIFYFDCQDVESRIKQESCHWGIC